MNTQSIIFRILIVIGLAVFSQYSNAATAVVSDDAFTTSASVKLKRGKLPTITVSAKETGFIRFDLSALPASLPQEQIAKATLRLWVSRVIRGGDVNVLPVDGEWNELDIAEVVAPLIGATPSGTINLPADRKAFYVSLDVTPLVRDWVTGSRANYGIALKPSGTSAAVFDSKENMATSHEPTLEIVLAGPRGISGVDGKDGKDGAPGEQGSPGPIEAGSAIYLSHDASIPIGYTDSGGRVANWQIKSILGPYVPEPNAIVTVGQRIFGYDGGKLSEFSPQNGNWSAPTTIGYPSAAIAGDGQNLIYFAGGALVVNQTFQGYVTNTFTYNVASGLMNPLPPCPVALVGYQAAFLNGRFYVIGHNQSGIQSFQFNVATNSWSDFSTPDGTAPDTMVAHNGFLFAFASSKLWQFSNEQAGWVERARLVFAPYGIVGVDASNLMLLGGPGGVCYRFSIETGELNQEAGIPSFAGGAGDPSFTVMRGDTVFAFQNNGSYATAPLNSFRRILIRD